VSFYGPWSTWICREHKVMLGVGGFGDPTDCFIENCVGDALYGNGMDTARLHKVLSKAGWYVPEEESAGWTGDPKGDLYDEKTGRWLK
jgi:hypothetical protein